MHLLENKFYQEDLAYLTGLNLPWHKLQNKAVLISGASGLIASCLVDALMQKNAEQGLGCTVYALGRDTQKAQRRFAPYLSSEFFRFIAHDINEPLPWDAGQVDLVLHMASNTHPVAYATRPIETVTTNIIGTRNLLEFAAAHGAQRFLFASSCEVYGENRGDTEFFAEDSCGYLNCNTLRAGYPESKRCGEALCQAYRAQAQLDIVLPRFARCYGPTMQMTDSKAIAQFLKKGLAGEDIVLKSEGTQFYSYTYAADAVSGLLTVLLLGQNGEAYNIADTPSDIRLKDLAQAIADAAGARVVFELPNAVEKAGYSTATKARLDGAKLKALGWQMHYDIRTGTARTLQILKALQ